MHRTQTSRSVGFTLIELMIVMTIIAIISAIAIPNLLSARVASNETAAIANLRTIWTGETQFQASAYADVDGDGNGEFGFIRELVGSVGVRTSADGSTTGRVVSPPTISSTFRSIDANGAAGRSGYNYVIRLPNASGLGIREAQTGAFSGSVDADLAENVFCIYAWPATFSTTGNRTFFVNQTGNLLQTLDVAYSGSGFYSTMVDGMAFAKNGDVNSITGAIATGTVGRDDNTWTSVN